jgi:prepilin-type N-terminal cleavage/methylation domain-containing protein
MHALARSFRAGGFTLIELLIVITIIVILMGLLFPAFKGVQDQAKRTQAKNDLTQIVTAVNAFYTEYGRYPTTATTDATATYGPGGSTTENGSLLSELRATTIVLNTRQIVFISPPDAKDQTNPRSGIKTSTSGYYDPWGTEYAIALDADYDNQIANPYSDSDGSAGAVQLRFGVIAYSVGKNGALGGGAAASSKYAAESGTAGKYKDSSDVISWQ